MTDASFANGWSCGINILPFSEVPVHVVNLEISICFSSISCLHLFGCYGYFEVFFSCLLLVLVAFKGG